MSVKGEVAAAAFCGEGTTTAIPLEANTVAIKALFTFWILDLSIPLFLSLMYFDTYNYHFHHTLYIDQEQANLHR